MRVSLLVVGALLVLFLILKLTGLGGQHGPGRHGAEAQGLTAAAVAAHVDATPPA